MHPQLEEYIVGSIFRLMISTCSANHASKQGIPQERSCRSCGLVPMQLSLHGNETTLEHNLQIFNALPKAKLIGTIEAEVVRDMQYCWWCNCWQNKKLCRHKIILQTMHACKLALHSDRAISALNFVHTFSILHAVWIMGLTVKLLRYTYI